MNKKEKPKGELVIQTIAMPAHTNPSGDIFGGWLVSQMDLGSAVLAHKCSKSRVTTVAIDKMTFIKAVQVGDTVCCYAEVIRFGRTSIAIHVEAWVVSHIDDSKHKVTQGMFTFVALDDDGVPTPIDWANN